MIGVKCGNIVYYVLKTQNSIICRLMDSSQFVQYANLYTDTDMRKRILISIGIPILLRPLFHVSGSAYSYLYKKSNTLNVVGVISVIRISIRIHKQRPEKWLSKPINPDAEAIPTSFSTIRGSKYIYSRRFFTITKLFYTHIQLRLNYIIEVVILCIICKITINIS